MMTPPARTYPLRGFQVAITLAFFFSLILLLPISDAAGDSSERLNLEERKVVIGSKPPACGNKCMKCRPCIATVVVPNHKTKCFKAVSDDSYYLLSWKCRCGNKFFQP
ncbi:hypothetical protein Fmac_020047 [Flemingia macrophylla]|uniref:Epidermal patterning factor-like protein n=1 Tax=Flemingia macrophylla TaxID=520843 RepID=A0ABD1M9J9_9FABA